MNSLKNLWNRLEGVRPFTEAEAWGLYRIAALSEAIGWTILISGILIHHLHVWGYNIAIPIAGQIHGTIFIIYFGILLATYTSLRWSRLKFLTALVAGVPPYGTLAFELWAAHTRNTTSRKIYFRYVLFQFLSTRVEST